MRDLSSNLDGVRAIAILLVVVSHVWPYFSPHLAPLVAPAALASYNFLTLGHVGVALFFVHTTLVLMMSLERRGSNAVAFFIRRAFRIYPLAMFMVLVMVILRARSGDPLSAGQIMSNLLLVQNFTGHDSAPYELWTLPYEVQMYLVLPALFLVARRSALWVSLLCVTSCALGLVLFYTVWHARTDVVSPFHFIPCFLPGALAFVLRRGALSPVWLFSYVIGAALILPLLVDLGAAETPLLWAMSLGLGLLIPKCRPITIEPVARAANVIATYSYGLYLTHVLAFALAFNAERGVGNWLLVAVLLPGLPLAVYRLIEQPGVALGQRLADRYMARISAARPGSIKPAASSAATP